jgi:putative peptide zinc metalloprotease protein
MAEAFLSPSWHRVGLLRPRLRPGLSVRRHRVQGQAWYVIHDPSSGKVFRFTPEVYSVISAMDGRRTMDEIWRDACERLGDNGPSQTAIVTLLSQLHSSDLLQADVVSDAAELFRRYADQRRKDRIGRYLNPMSIRFRLVDPDRFLSATVFLVRPLISWFGMLIWLATVAAALVLLGPRWDELTSNIADHVLSADGLLLLALVFPMLKLIHEFGHAYAAKAGGSAVHEMGIMFVALLPVPYVDASGSAAFRSKWRRAGVAAAGMIVETFVAALAAFVWLNAEPGLIRAIAFNVMLVAGVSTVVFNANPLLRLDGYYIFSDLIEVPNLAQRSTRFWGWLCDRRLFGADVERPEATVAERFWFLAYAPLAFLYRMIVLFGIAMFLATTWFVIGVLIAVIGVAMGVVWPMLKALWHVLSAPSLQRVRFRAVTLTALGVVAVPALLFLVPVPLRTTTEGVIWLPETAYVRAGADGFVRAVEVLSGSPVARGALLVSSEDPVLKAEASVLRAQIDALSARLDSEQFTDRIKASVTEQELHARREELQRSEERLAALDVTAAEAGIVEIPRQDDLVGRWIRRGEVLGYVTQGYATEVHVVVPQADIGLVRSQLVGAEMLLPGEVDRPVPLTLLREVPAASDRLPSRALAVDAGGTVAVDARDPKDPRSLERWFQLDFALPPGTVHNRFEGRAFVRFDHGWEPLGDQLWRRARQLFLARLNA